MRPSCVYCGRDKETTDHVPPKLLLERPFPPNLPTVPACRDCNNGYSDDEEYFRTILAHVGVTPTLSSKIEPDAVVDRALLEHSPGQEQDLLNSIVVTEDGLPMLEPDFQRLRRVVRKIAAGLAYLDHSRRVHPSQVRGRGLPHLPEADRDTIAHRLAGPNEEFRSGKWTDVQPEIFSYIFTRYGDAGDRLACLMNFHREFWAYASVPPPDRAESRCSEPDQPGPQPFRAIDRQEEAAEMGADDY